MFKKLLATTPDNTLAFMRIMLGLVLPSWRPKNARLVRRLRISRHHAVPYVATSPPGSIRISSDLRRIFR